MACLKALPARDFDIVIGANLQAYELLQKDTPWKQVVPVLQGLQKTASNLNKDPASLTGRCPEWLDIIVSPPAVCLCTCACA
jgi:hypothetical protein